MATAKYACLLKLLSICKLDFPTSVVTVTCTVSCKKPRCCLLSSVRAAVFDALGEVGIRWFLSFKHCRVREFVLSAQINGHTHGVIEVDLDISIQ